MTRTHFRAHDLTVTLISGDPPFPGGEPVPSECPSGTCCGPPTDMPCDLSLMCLGPGLTQRLNVADLVQLINLLKNKLSADIVVSSTPSYAQQALPQLTSVMGPPVQRAWVQVSP
jgi:hypothetical protein